jgi:transposase
MEPPEATEEGARAQPGGDPSFHSRGLAESKKNARRLGAHIVFVDESGFQLTPSIASTWAPVGQTPTVHHFDRRDRVSVISGISVSPRRQRLNLYFQLFTENIRQQQVRDFLRQLLRQIRGHIFVLWDGGNPHRGRLVRELCARSRRLHLLRFPAYAPEFNPDEGVWKLAKQRLANRGTHDLPELMLAVLESMEAIRGNGRNLRACITHSALPPFLR